MDSNIAQSDGRLYGLLGERRIWARTIAVVSASVLLVSAGLFGPASFGSVFSVENDAPVSDPEPNPSSEPTPELPTGDSELRIALVLPGDKISGDNLAALNGAELAIRDINGLATKEYLGGEKSQTNTVKDSTIRDLSHYFMPTSDAEAKKLVDVFITAKVDVIVTLKTSSVDAAPSVANLVALASEAGIPVFYANDQDHFAQSFPDELLTWKLSGTAGPIVAELLQQLQDDAATSVSYLYLPDAEGNAIRRQLAAQLPEFLKENTTGQKPADDQTENDGDEKATEAQQSVLLLPLYFDPTVIDQTFVSELVSQVQAAGSSHVIVHLGQTAGDSELLGKLEESLGQAGIEASQILVTGVAEKTLLSDGKLVLEGVEGLRLVGSSSGSSAEFSKRLKQVDPWTSTSPVAEQIYESIVRIQLARVVAEDDNGQRILAEANGFAGNNNYCDSYDLCAYVLNYTQNINYQGASHLIQTSQVQADDSFLVLNSSNDVK